MKKERVMREKEENIEGKRNERITRNREMRRERREGK